MNLNQQEAILFVLMGVSLAFFGALSGKVLATFITRAREEYAQLRNPSLIPSDVANECLDVHGWQDVKLALKGLPLGVYKICTKCGKISGNDSFMLSAALLAKVNEGTKLLNKQLEEEARILERIENLARGYVHHYAKRLFPKEMADEDFAAKLLEFGEYAMDALNKADQKIADEIDAQTDLNDQYHDWPSKVKGEA